MKIAIDFDNTFYVDNRDVDDGMALMYLLGSPGVDLVSVTSTFGNSTIDAVDDSTVRLIEFLGLDSNIYAIGASECGDYFTPASQRLVDLANQYPGELKILATGSMTNLAGAYLIDADFFEKVEQIVIMGGITERLMFAKREMWELNLSVDPHASWVVLSKGKNVSIMTGNHCLDLLFTEKQYEEYFAEVTTPKTQLIKEYTAPWFKDNEEEYGIQGFYNWDTLAAAYLVNPEYFTNQWADYHISLNSLSTGSLIANDFDPTSYAQTRPVRKVYLNLPVIKIKEELKHHIYQTWLKE